MKIHAFNVAALLLSSSLMAQQPFTINGNIKGLNSKFIYMSYPTGSMNYRTDSAAVNNGKFIFKGTLSQPTQARLYVDKQKAMYGEGEMLTVFIEPAVMTLKGENAHFDQLQLTGSASQLEQNELDKARQPVEVKLKPLSAAYSKAGKAYRDAIKAKKSEAELNKLKEAADQIKEQMEPYYEQMEKIDKAFIDQHPASYVAANLLRWRVSSMPLQEGESYYAKMPPALQQSLDGMDIRKELDGLKMGSPGSEAHGFTKTDINGNTIHLSDFQGKYVLLDFWASWCGPCRKGNPHLKSLYAKYKDKGLEIIGVSDDDSKPEAWKKAVEQDGIGIWKHVLRGLDWNKRQAGVPNPEDISDYYGIHSLPTKILIDPKGVIIGRYGGGGEDDEAMDKKFSSLFGS
ncbi:TlpA disulfide reductase family protein [Chitinophaga vietnamensis]|uniref:TlpA disulfide reductase family protein n=1 Tax=Chitinophaga vietnamensis TaxID=2593957 RepID=UPI0011778331|nr:TlpA disulfide reductase family protein [Chitinophaga vietnamensis]